jgi:hypothetical protein
MIPAVLDTHHNNALHYAECHYGECRVLFTVMLSVILLSVVMVSVVAPWREFTKLLTILLTERASHYVINLDSENPALQKLP